MHLCVYISVYIPAKIGVLHFTHETSKLWRSFRITGGAGMIVASSKVCAMPQNGQERSVCTCAATQTDQFVAGSQEEWCIYHQITQWTFEVIMTL